MASRLTEIVTAFADQVKVFAVQAQEGTRQKKLARALKGVADALGDETMVLNDGEVDAQVFATAAENIEHSMANASEMGGDLAKSARKVEGYVEDDVLDDDDVEIAKAALALWSEVKPTGRLMAVRGSARDGDRQSTPDFLFPIFATCEECGDVIRTGERSGVTDWNSLRHYAQRHAQNVHSSSGFDTMVTNAWRSAKAEFAGNAEAVEVDGDGNTPGFVLEKQAS